jgi:hypothetical protein
MIVNIFEGLAFYFARRAEFYSIDHTTRCRLILAYRAHTHIQLIDVSRLFVDECFPMFVKLLAKLLKHAYH